jgi:RNA polymerase sigma factor (sigma-70 family)
MQTQTDAELLHEYARSGSEAAFAEIVRRYADFVYSAALRQTSDAELARDVAQVVFVDLARKARALHPNTLLIGWLCRAARLAAIDQLRRQHRRLHRERQAMKLADSPTEIPDDWSAVRPVLDEALAELGEEDRNALLLRFFKNESLASVGVTLGVSEDAAQKRVSRALTKLREILVGRGVRTSAAALGVALTANGIQAAPTGFAASLTAGALASVSAASSSIPLLNNLLALNHMKTAIMALALTGGVAGLTALQLKTRHQLETAQATIQQQNEAVQQLQAVKDQLAAQAAELERTRAEAQEAVRLRGEIASLRRAQAQAPAPAVATAAQPSAAAVTNSVLPNIQLAGKFFLLPTDDLKALQVAWTGTPDGTAMAVLSHDQFQTISQALDGANDVKFVGAPTVVTLAGMEARLTGVGGSTLASASGSGALLLPGRQAVVAERGLVSETTNNPGPTLSVLMHPTESSSTFDMDLTAGFSQWVDRSAEQDGSQKELQSTQSKTRLALILGQTVVLAKELPNTGLTEADSAIPGPKSLLMFVTPSNFHFATRLTAIIKRAPTNESVSPAEQ